MIDLSKYIEENQQIDVEIKRLYQEVKDISEKLEHRKKVFNDNAIKISTELCKYGILKDITNIRRSIPLEKQKLLLKDISLSVVPNIYTRIYSTETFTRDNTYAILSKGSWEHYVIDDFGQRRHLGGLTGFKKQ